MKYDGTSYHLSEILRIERFGPQEKGGDKAVAGAAVGSLLFGVVGAVAGAGSRRFAQEEDLGVCIYFNDGEYVIPEFDLSRFNEARDASRLQATKNLLEQPAESQQP